MSAIGLISLVTGVAAKRPLLFLGGFGGGSYALYEYRMNDYRRRLNEAGVLSLMCDLKEVNLNMMRLYMFLLEYDIRVPRRDARTVLIDPAKGYDLGQRSSKSESKSNSEEAKSEKSETPAVV